MKRLSHTNTCIYSPQMEKEMATHSSVLAWRIPGTVEPGGLLSMGSHRVGHDWSDIAAAAAFSPKPHSHPGWHTTLSSVPCKTEEFLSENFSLHILLLFSSSLMSDSSRSNGLQHARLPCPSLSPGVPTLLQT